MYKGKIVCVVVPAFNEEKLIQGIVEGISDFVDKMVIVDHHSQDITGEVAQALAQNSEGGVKLIRHG